MFLLPGFASKSEATGRGHALSTACGRRGRGVLTGTVSGICHKGPASRVPSAEESEESNLPLLRYPPAMAPRIRSDEHWAVLSWSQWPVSSRELVLRLVLAAGAITLILWLVAGCTTTPIPPTYTQQEVKAICERNHGWWHPDDLVGGLCETFP